MPTLEFLADIAILTEKNKELEQKLATAKEALIEEMGHSGSRESTERVTSILKHLSE